MYSGILATHPNSRNEEAALHVDDGHSTQSLVISPASGVQQPI
jgi:hypothetical protein